jgi:hypothetical protein
MAQHDSPIHWIFRDMFRAQFLHNFFHSPVSPGNQDISGSLEVPHEFCYASDLIPFAREINWKT